MHSECVRIKLEPVQGQANKLHFHHGISFKEDNLVLYNDHKVLNFNHPTHSSYAAIEAVEELNGEINDPEAIKKLDSLNLP